MDDNLTLPVRSSESTIAPDTPREYLAEHEVILFSGSKALIRFHDGWSGDSRNALLHLYHKHPD